MDNERTRKWYYHRYPEEDPDVQNPGTFREHGEKLATANHFFEFTQVCLAFRGTPDTQACFLAHAGRPLSLSLRLCGLLLLCAEGNFATGKVGGGSLCQEEAQRGSGDAGSFITQQASKEAAKVSFALISHTRRSESIKNLRNFLLGPQIPVRKGQPSLLCNLQNTTSCV